LAISTSIPLARSIASLGIGQGVYLWLTGLLMRLADRKLLALVLVLNIGASLIWAVERQHSLQDLGSFLHSGAAYTRDLNPYARHFWVHPQPISTEALNLNPPISVYVFAALNYLDVTLVKYAFFAGTILLFTAGVLLLLRAYPDKRDPLVLLAVFAMAGLWHLLGYLQIYAPLFLAAVGAWLMMRRGNPLLAGAMIGMVIAIKPNFGLWPVFLLAAGHPRIAFSAVGTAAGISAIPLLIDGPTIYRQWLELSLAFDGLEWASNASLISIGARLGSPFAGHVIAVVAVLGLLYWQWRFKGDAHQASTYAIFAVLLYGPVSWAGYTLFLLPFLFSRPWTHGTWLGVLMLTLPFWLVRYLTVMGPIPNAVLGPMYGWALLLLLYVAVTEDRRQRRRQRTESPADAGSSLKAVA
jgi:hypothetical protein